MYALADNRVMFLDLDIAKKVDELGVNMREAFSIRRASIERIVTTGVFALT